MMLRDTRQHAFGNDRLRWHVCAYCHIDEKFKDFLLSRCLEARSDGEPGATPADDTLWDETFSVVLSPNPALHKLYGRAYLGEGLKSIRRSRFSAPSRMTG